VIEAAAPTAVRIPSGAVVLDGDLSVPRDARGVVVFAHGSGSSRHSPRNRFVAHEMEAAGFATLLLDLLTGPEEILDDRTRRLRFDIGFLAHRLLHAVGWTSKHPATAALRVGLFGASTGAAAALVTAAWSGKGVAAVVSRGGRPDLAWTALPAVGAPTLLIVGGEDTGVLGLNEKAYERLVCEKELAVVPGATHLFEEPGALGEVARLAADWFQSHLEPASAVRGSGS
jgi:dienelactone hydrolase